MRKNILILCVFLIAVLFIYTATSKFIDIPRFRHDMLNQPFPHWMSKTAVWLIPSLEVLSVGLLVFERTRLAGLWLAWSLIFMFTLYTGLVLGKTFGHIPCGCGGFIRELTWTQHLYLNIFYLVTASTAVVLQCQLELIKLFHAPGTGQTENLQKRVGKTLIKTNFMKKMKLFLLAAMIIGMGSAFTTTKVSKTDLWVKDVNGDAITYQHGTEDLFGSCQPNTDPYCVFEDEALTIPVPEYGSGRFAYP